MDQSGPFGRGHDGVERKVVNQLYEWSKGCKLHICLSACRSGLLMSMWTVAADMGAQRRHWKDVKSTALS